MSAQDVKPNVTTMEQTIAWYEEGERIAGTIMARRIRLSVPMARTLAEARARGGACPAYACDTAAALASRGLTHPVDWSHGVAPTIKLTDAGRRFLAECDALAGLMSPPAAVGEDGGQS